MCIRIMGRGEYAGDAKSRFTAGGKTETPSEFLLRNFNGGGSTVPPSTPDRHNQKTRICPTIGFMTNHGVTVSGLEIATKIAELSGRPAGEELIRNGSIGRVDFAKITAKFHNVEYSANGPSPDYLTGHTAKSGSSRNDTATIAEDSEFFGIVTEYRGWQEKPRIYIASEPAVSSIIEKLVLQPKIANTQISISTRKAINHCQFVAGAARHLKNSISGLATNHPQLSASRVVTTNQSLTILFLIMGIATSGWFWPVHTLLILHLMASLFYVSLTLMRAAMIIPGAVLVNKIPYSVSGSKSRDNDLPVYTVMVALHREAGQVDELVGSLKQINWPKDRLQILLICEADDPDTVVRCQYHSQDERFQTVICPVSEPRTKPKALNFALPLVTGEFLVLYDAEDRPHRDQLREAYDKFQNHPDTACLQAPLVIHNDTQSWFTRMFAIEYTTQFSLILPVLEKWNSPIPLGGTSNHFHTKILRKIGAWDPYNVTEDADLGIRLARFGYRCRTLTLATLEEAPPVFDVWFKQRTRWIKGWLQTLLVHMRHPVTLGRDLGVAKTVFFHLVITAIVVSVLIHPLFIISTIYYAISLAGDARMDIMSASLLGIDVFNLVGGYSTYFAICWLALEGKHRVHLRRSIIWLPVYWVLISLAGWRAVWQLFTNPFLWEKTRHGFAAKTSE